jgi:hypothetical protein
VGVCGSPECRRRQYDIVICESKLDSQRVAELNRDLLGIDHCHLGASSVRAVDRQVYGGQIACLLEAFCQFEGKLRRFRQQFRRLCGNCAPTQPYQARSVADSVRCDLRQQSGTRLFAFALTQARALWQAGADR